MLTSAQKNELLGIEAMAKMLMERARQFRKNVAPEDSEIKKRKPTKKQQVKQYVTEQFARRRERLIKQHLQTNK